MGLTPASPEIVRACPHQEDRWKELESLYGQYLNCLEKARLADTNAARITAAKASLAPPNIRSVILAGVPDLNRISQQYLENLEAAGVSVTVLVDAPDCDGARFDAWGRPDVETWPQRTLPLRLADIAVAADPSSEADIVASLLGPHAAAGICAADADIIPFHDRALRQRGLKPYDPAGKSLAAFECATLSRLWLSFCSSDRLGELRTLAEHPVFLQALCRASQLGPTVPLAALDETRTDMLIETLADAVAYFDERVSAAERRPRAAALTAGAQKLRKKFGTPRSLSDLSKFLHFVYGSRQVLPGSGEAEALAALSGLLRAILESSLNTGNAGEAVFCEEMKSVAVFERRSGTEIELNGWLEAPWLPQSCSRPVRMHRRRAPSAGFCASVSSGFPSQRTGHAKQRAALCPRHLPFALPACGARTGCGEARVMPHRGRRRTGEAFPVALPLHGCGASFACDTHLQSWRLAAHKAPAREGVAP